MKHRTIGINRIWRRVAAVLLCVFLMPGICGCGEFEPLPSPIIEEPIAGSGSEETDAAGKDTAGSGTAAEDGEGLPVDGTGEEDLTGTEEESMGAEEEREIDPDTVIHLIMVGDILLHTPVEDCSATGDGGYDYSPIFAAEKETIQAADLALVNQEVIIGGAELGVSGYPAFNAPTQIADALVDTGFDVVLQATNHALDKGKAGLVNDLTYWEQTYPEIAVLGIQKEAEKQDEIYIYEQGGLRIAILNYTYGTNGIPLPDDMPYAVNLLDEEKVEADLQKAEELADFTIVCPHWGTEYRLSPDSMQEKWTEIFRKCGADLVIGAHPHVIEPIEWVGDEENPQQMLVYYSLGNFVNWTSGTGDGVTNRMVGGMAEVDIAWNEQGKAVIADYGVRALICHVENGFGGVRVYDLASYTQELAERNAIVLQDVQFSKDLCVNLCNNVWGGLWH